MRILIVEDESLVAIHIEDMLLDLGHEVVGSAGRLEQALAMAREFELDLALLDVNLGLNTSFPVANVLLSRQIPIIFATGYGQRGLVPPFEKFPTVQKPFTVAQLAQTIGIATRPSSDAN